MVKLGWMNGKVVNVQPEYEDVAERARSHNRSWKDVHQAAMTAAIAQYGTGHETNCESSQKTS